MTQKKTLAELMDFITSSKTYLKEFPEETKLAYALKKTVKKSVKHFDAFNEEATEVAERIEDVKSLNCAVDKDGIQLREESGNYRFTPANDVKARAEIRAINKEWNAKSKILLEAEVDFEPFIVSQENLPSNLNDSYREAFTGFVI